MVKLGEIKKYIDIDGTKFEGIVIALTEFNYITIVNDIVPNIAFKGGEYDMLDFLNVTYEDKENKCFVVHNKNLKDVKNKYKKTYSSILKYLRQDKSICKSFNGFYRCYNVDDERICININDACKLYKEEGFIEIFKKSTYLSD